MYWYVKHTNVNATWLMLIAATFAFVSELPTKASSQGDYTNSAGVLTCSSNDGNRKTCPANTQGGVRLLRQLSGSPCTQGSTWGYDASGIWVDRGCRAEFELIPLVTQRGGAGTSANISITCSSNGERRKNCPVNTQGGVRLVRQLSGSPCTEGNTWGYDANGIWVDRGCRAEFEILPVSNRPFGRGNLGRTWL